MIDSACERGVGARPWLNRAHARPGSQAGGDVRVTVPVATVLTVAGATVRVLAATLAAEEAGVLVAGATVCALGSTAQVYWAAVQKGES